MVDLGPLAPSRAWLLQLADPGEPRVMCCLMSSYVGMDGVPYDTIIESVPVAPDDAGDLAGHPRSWAELVERTSTMLNAVRSTWRVHALGFIEQDAIEEHDRAVAELRRQIADDGEQR